MESISGGGRRFSRKKQGSPDGGRPDRISALSDDMLLRILGWLGCARNAARTTVLLSRRWRGLFALHWECPRQFVLRDVVFSSLEATLSRVCLCHPSTMVYGIRTRVHGRCTPDMRGHNSLLRAASRLRARELILNLPERDLCEGSSFIDGCFHNQQPSLLRATCYVYLRPGLMHDSKNCPSTEDYFAEPMEVIFSK